MVSQAYERLKVAYEEFPVQPGEIWNAGPCILACGDLERGAGTELANRFGPPDLVYADPPWNAGIARAFRTRAGIGRPVDFGALIAAVVRAAADARELWIEMGHQERQRTRQAIRDGGFIVIDQHPITYGNARPANLIRAVALGREPVLPLEFVVPEGMNDEETPGYVLGFTPAGSLIYDPCIGLGCTAAAAMQHGHALLGLELSPKRLAATLMLLAQLGYEPIRSAKTLTSMW